MQLIWQYLRLIRFPMTFAPVGAFVVGIIQSQKRWPSSPDELISIVAIFFLSAGTLAYNGYEDRDIDARKGEPFAKLHPKVALFVAIISFSIGTALSRMASVKIVLLFLFFVLAAVLYSRVCVKIPVLKNVLAALLSAFLILFCATVGSSVNIFNLLTTLVIFFAIMAMEIVKDVEDIEVDRGFRITLPHLMPMSHIRITVAFCITGAISIGFIFPSRTVPFIILYAIASAAFMMAVLRLPNRLTPEIDHVPRKLIYVGLWIGLMAFLAPVL